MTFAILAIVCGVFCLAGFVLRIVLRGRFALILALATAACFAGFTAFLIIWARKTFEGDSVTHATWAFLLLALSFGCLVASPFLRGYNVATYIDMALFLGFAIAAIVVSIYLSKAVLQGPEVLSSSALIFL